MLTLALANSIIEHALRRAREHQLRPMTIVVVDVDGHLIAAQREDGASMFRFDIALGKAWGAAAFGISSRAIARRAAENPNFFSALTVTAQGRLIPQQGAAVIRDHEGRIIGAAGASGDTGDEDEACCASGVEEAGLVSDVAP